MGTLLMFPPKVHFNDDNGIPLSGGKIYTYKASEVTLIPKDTYTDKARSAAHTNPIILDSRGEAEVWLDGEYKFIIKDSNDVEIYTVDNASTETVIGADTDAEWFSPGQTPTFIDAVSFSVEDDQTAIYHEGRRVRCTVTAGTVYGVVKTVAFTTLTTVTVVLDTGALDSGLSVVDVGLLSALNQSYPIQQIQYGGYAYVPDTGIADFYVAVMVPPLYAYKTGFQCKILMTNANATTTPTININGLGVKTIKRQTGTPLVANDILANKIAEFVYDGTDMILLNNIPPHTHTDNATGGIIGYPLYSDGIDGAYSSGATGNIDGDEKNYTTYIVNDTHVMTINTGRGVIIIADVSITIEGTIDASGLGAAGAVSATGNGGAVSLAILSGSGSASGGGGGSDSVSTLGGTGGSSTCKMRTVTGGVSNAGTTADNGITHPITDNMGPEPRVGSGGGAGGSGSGNEGGAGGGFIILIAPIVIIEATATLDVSGVDGNAGGAGGSGGGGGGGSITIISHDYTDNGGTFTLTGGTGGVASGGGRAGGDGGTGIKRVVEL